MNGLPDLRMIDVRRAMRTLQNRLNPCEGTFDFGDFVSHTPNRSPFVKLTSHVDDPRIELVGKCPVIQNFQTCIDEKEEKVGYLFITRGYFEQETDSIFEAIKLRIKTPLRKKDGSYIPGFGIKYSVGKIGSLELAPERRDVAYHFGGLYRVTIDLTDILPNEKFRKSN